MQTGLVACFHGCKKAGSKCLFPAGMLRLYLREKPQIRRSVRGWHMLLLPSWQHSWKECRGESVPVWPPLGQSHMLSSYFAALVSYVN